MSRPGDERVPRWAIRPVFSPIGPASTTEKPRVGPRWMIGSIRLRLLGRGVHVGAGHRPEPGLRVGRRSVLASATTARDPLLEQALAGLLEQEPADDPDHGGRQHQGGGDHPGLDGAAPEGQPTA